MSYQSTYSSSPDYVIEADYTEIPKESLVTQVKALFGAPSMESTMQQAELDRCHALLTASALRHTVALSVLEQKAADVAPQGAHRYAALVDSYAESSVRMIRRWR